MARRRMLVVMNPSAHDWEARDRWPQLEPVLAATGELTLLNTVADNAETVASVAEKVRAGFDRVVAIGGDGTVRLVCSGILRGAPQKPPELAVIPFGTANNVSKSLKLPLDDLRAMAQIAGGERLTGLDVCWAALDSPSGKSEHVWVNCVGVGMDADVVAARGRYRGLGSYTSYAAAMAERALEQRSLDVALTLDGAATQHRVFNAVVTNVPLYAGALAMPNARMDDGILDVYLFGRNEYGSKVLSYFIKQADILDLGVSGLLDEVTQNQREFHGREVRIRLAYPRAVQVDGDAVGEASDMVLRVVLQLRTACGT
ncbi:MAG: hypothetical protein HY904_11995 [Deltaproteobacteria bacterium]|nr:hypothetical protein [Deltaproteobacteria bacterium]